MNNFQELISLVGTSDLKGYIHSLSSTDERNSFLLRSVDEEMRGNHCFIIYENGSDDKLRRMLKALKDLYRGETALPLQIHHFSPSTVAFYRQLKGKNMPTLMSLPKENYIEARLLCGARLAEIVHEVKGDAYQENRLREFLNVRVQDDGFQREKRVVEDPTAGIYDAESEVERMNGPFEYVEMVTPIAKLLIDNNEIPSDNGKEERNRIEATEVQRRDVESASKESNDPVIGTQFAADASGDQRQSGDSYSDGVSIHPSANDEGRDAVGGEPAREGSFRMGGRGVQDEGDAAGIHPGGSGENGTDNQADVRRNGGTSSGVDGDLRLDVVHEGVKSVHEDAKRTGLQDDELRGDSNNFGNGDGLHQVTVEEDVIHNENIYLDSEHSNVVIPKAGTLSAFKANVRAIRTLADIIRRGDVQTSREEQETLKMFTGFGGQTTRFIAKYSSSLDYSSKRDLEESMMKWTEEGLAPEEADALDDSDTNIDSAVGSLCQALKEANSKGNLAQFGITSNTQLNGYTADWNREAFALSRDLLRSFVMEGKYDYWTPNGIAKLGGIIAKEFGLQGGRILEPSAGIGNMVHAFDRESISRMELTCVEPNIVTGLINRMLHPEATVLLCPIEKANVGRHDFVLTNSPFVDGLSVADRKFFNDPDKRYGKSLNNLTGYFPLKMIEQTEPGGLCVCLITTSFLNASKYEMVRQLIDEKAKLVGAVRFPSGIFPDTAVNTDLLIFQKKRAGEKLGEKNEFVKTTEQVFSEDGQEIKYKVNEYFMAHPEHVIGMPQKNERGSVYYRTDLNFDAITQQAEGLVRNIVSRFKGQMHNTLLGNREVQSIPQEVPVLDMDKPICRDYMILKEAYQKLVEADIQRKPESESCREKLNAVYDAFLLKYGNLNSDKVKKALQNDKPDYLKIAALEIVETKENLITNICETTYRKSDIFDHSTILPNKPSIEGNDPKELVYFSFATEGRINTQLLRERLGDEWEDQCSDYIFRNPDTGAYELANIYLSGHIGEKLDSAKEAALHDASYERNVAALEKAMPKRITIDEITVNMGSDIVDVDVYQNFLKMECMNLVSRRDIEKSKCEINYNSALHTWKVSFTQKEASYLRSYDVRRPDCNARRIFEAAFNDQYVQVNDKDDYGNPRVNESLTLVANSKVKEIREKFEAWIHANAPKECMDAVEDNFNRRFNQFVSPNWDSMVVNLEGCTVVPREHQRNVVARGLTNDDMLMHHAVGAGKTLAMGMTMMERIRLGIAHKCCLLTMKANASQIAIEIQNAYPNAKILFPSERDFEKENRNIFLNRIKHSDADIVILTHDQFNLIKHEEKYQQKFVQWQVDAITALKEKEEDGGLTPSELKKLETAEANLRAKVENDNEKLSKDDISWTELGFDNLAVDEAHIFKNLYFSTNHTKVKGINTDSDSKRAMHLFMAVRDIQDKNGGDKGVIFATGTPISNSLVEFYNWEVYLVPTQLRKQGITCFDKWADVFAQRQSDWEPDELGRAKLVERFRNFVNLQSLLTTYKGFADVITEKDLIERNLVPSKPKAQYMQVVVPFDSKTDAAVFNELKDIMDFGRSDLLNVDLTDSVHRMSSRSLVVITAGGKASISPKMLELEGTDYDTIHTKVEYVAKNVARIYRQTNNTKATQLIFCDSYQSTNGNYNLYKDLKETLTTCYGISAKEIRTTLDIKEKERNTVYEQVNKGEVRILIGSTQKLGTGVNVQKKACAAHMVDVNWTPSGMIQKTGRVARQGNLFARDFLDNKVPVYLYVKEQSTDAKKYGLVFAKQRMIEQITDKDFKGNRFDEGKSDSDTESEIFQEMLASATGDNTSMVKNKLERQYDILVKEMKGHETYRNGLNRNILENEKRQVELARQYSFVCDLNRALDLNNFKKDDHGKYPFAVEFNGKVYNTAKELGREMVMEMAASISGKRFLNMKLSAYGMTAMLQGSKSDYNLLLTKYRYSDIGETERESLGLKKPINVKNMAQEMESVGRMMNNLCLSIREKKQSYENTMNELSAMQKNLMDQKEKSAEFPKMKEMTDLRKDIELLEKSLKRDDFDKEVGMTLVNIINAQEQDNVVFLIRERNELKIYNTTEAIGFRAMGEQGKFEIERDNISSNDIIRLKDDASIQRFLSYAEKECIHVTYIDNLSEMLMSPFDPLSLRKVDSVRDLSEIKPMMAEGAKADENRLKMEEARLAELRSLNAKSSEMETDEVKQMKSNVITWKEMGFPDPNAEVADLTDIHDVNNMAIPPFVNTVKRKPYEAILEQQAVAEAVAIASETPKEYLNINHKKFKTMEVEMNEKDLSKQLREFEKAVCAQEIGMDMQEARFEYKESTLEDEVLMEASLEDELTLKKQIQKEMETHSESAKDNPQLLEYVEKLTKLEKRLNGIDYSIKLHIGDERYDKVVAKMNGDTSANISAQEEPKKQEKNAEAKGKKVPMQLPSKLGVGYGQLSDVRDKEGKQVELNVPKIRLQFDMSLVNGNRDKMNVTKNRDGEEMFHFAVVKNKTKKAEQSPYEVIVRRNGQSASVNGESLKFSDSSAIMEFQVSLKDLKEKATKVGLDAEKGKVPLVIGSLSGSTGVKINEKSSALANKEIAQEDLEIKGKSYPVNQFDRVIKMKLNMDESLSHVRYENKTVGDAISSERNVELSKKDGSKYARSVTDFYATLSAKSLKDLPEADAFGNVKLALCTKRTDEKYLAENKLTLDGQGHLMSESGKRVPDLSVVADPKTYKNGQPYANTIRVVTVGKDDLLSMPKLGENNDISLRIDGLTGKVELNTARYIREGQTDDVTRYIQERTGDKSKTVDPQKPYLSNVSVPSVVEHYNPKIAQLETMSWNKITPKMDNETFKNAPSQYDVFKNVVTENAEKQAKELKENVQKTQNEAQSEEETLTKGKKI